MVIIALFSLDMVWFSMTNWFLSVKEIFLLLETQFVLRFGDDMCMCVSVHMLREGDRGMLCKLSQFLRWSQKN